MKTTITSILALAATLTLFTLQPAAAQSYHGGSQQSAYQSGNGNNSNSFAQPSIPPNSQLVQLVDQQSPYGAVVAFEHAIPANWQASGKVTWNQREDYPGCGYADNHFRWSASSNDRRQEMGYLPQVIYSGFISDFPIGNPNKGCENVIIGDPKKFLTAHIKTVRPGAKIKKYTPPTQQEMAQVRQILPQMQRMSQDTTSGWDFIAATLIISYVEKGVSYDEFLTAATLIYSVKTTGSAPQEVKMNVVLPIYYMRAPAGQLDENKALAYSTAMRDNPQYQQMLKSISDAKVKKNSQKMAAQSRARISALRNSTSASGSSAVDFSTADILADGWKKRSASSEAFQARAAASAGGVARYTDPQSNTGYYETEVGQGDRVFRLDNGSTVVTDDYFYNNGVQLSPVQ